MSDPVNVVRLASGLTEVYRSRTGAQRIARDLFWGPERTTQLLTREFVRTPVEDLPWWPDGAAILDEARRALLIWSGGEESLDVPLRRVLLERMRCMWVDWDVQWCSSSDLERYLTGTAKWSEDAASHAVASDQEHRLASLSPSPNDGPWPVGRVLSLRREDGTLRFWSFGDLSHAPPAISEQELRPSRWRERLFGGLGDAELRLGHTPRAGTHVDLQKSTVEFWSAALLRCREEVEKLFPGFRVLDADDRFEVQLEACEGQLRFSAPDEQTLVGQWRACLCDEDPYDHLDRVTRTELFAEAEARWKAVGSARGARTNPWRRLAR